MLSFPFVNGNAYSFASIEAQVLGRPYKGFKNINYKHGMSPTMIYGTDVQSLGSTRGQYKPEGDCEMYREDWFELRTALGPGWMEVVVPIVVVYQELPQPTQTDLLPAVRFVGEDNSNADGSDGLTVKLSLHFLAPIQSGLLPPFLNASL